MTKEGKMIENKDNNPKVEKIKLRKAQTQKKQRTALTLKKNEKKTK
jgi:hypothetical protein